MSQKNVTLVFINQFSKFFYWHTLYTIGNKASTE